MGNSIRGKQSKMSASGNTCSLDDLLGDNLLNSVWIEERSEALLETTARNTHNGEEFPQAVEMKVHSLFSKIDKLSELDLQEITVRKIIKIMSAVKYVVSVKYFLFLRIILLTNYYNRCQQQTLEFPF